ncbi:alkaline phosphatase family protein [Paenimyroides tangerinum]|uniref:Alkaline phosphatase family protein n=1 Tax=Paenimyroides tangerinum TaxID=2488728 RepID=A0A3P3WFT1_9FLAO|nr:alkaline phosphatase family protein [Paenimyroides tangerinum]RRJ93247.1 alkaline phosphatase family protein [Paenimyroides tangerinum]
MNKPKNTLTLFLQRFLLLIIIYQLIRIGFYFYNQSFFQEINLKIFLGGLIFDLAILGYINIIFVILHLVPGKFQENKKYQNFLFYSFFIINGIILSTNFIDYEYFRFIGRRSSFSIITAEGMSNEIGGLLISYIKDYWQIPIMMIISLFTFWLCLKKIKYQTVKTFSKIGNYVTLLFVVGLLFIAGRGIGRKPISLVDATNYGPIGSSALVLNTPFSIMKTLSKKENLKEIKYFSEAEAKSIFNPIQTFSYPEFNKKNVVLIILESFGNENIQRGQTPFLDSLIQKSYYFKNAFANGKLSIDAVPSTISSIPGLMNKSIISSNYALNEVNGLPKILKENGYETSFFHGAFNGSQNFDKYANVAGFDTYYGKDEYIGPKSFDGKWGVFDEDFMQFFAKEINNFKQPFFTTLFTVSSHAPFTIPEKYKNKFPKGTTEIHESIAYTDFALKEFFKTAEKMPWYENTIFVITSDHTSSTGEELQYKNNVGKFRIPILFYVPNDESMIAVDEKNFQQIDILPSLMDYLQLNTKIISYGKSYKSKDDYVVNYLDNVYNLEMGDFYLAFDGTKTLGLYNWKTDPLLKENLSDKNPENKQKMERFIKAYIQSFNHRVSKNQLTVK